MEGFEVRLSQPSSSNPEGTVEVAGEPDAATMNRIFGRDAPFWAHHEYPTTDFFSYNVPLDSPSALGALLRALRRQQDINTEISVVHDIRLKELRLYTDSGRTCRPLFIVEDQQLLIMMLARQKYEAMQAQQDRMKQQLAELEARQNAEDPDRM